MSEESPVITLRYKRLETTGAYCNVEIGAEVQLTPGLQSSDEFAKTINSKMAILRDTVNNEVEAAKRRRQEEELAERKARQEEYDREERERRAHSVAEARRYWLTVRAGDMTPADEIAFIHKALDKRALDSCKVAYGLRRALTLYDAMPEAEREKVKETVDNLRAEWGFAFHDWPLMDEDLSDAQVAAEDEPL